jgi:hypothetical protein
MFRFLRLLAATALAAFVLSGCATGYLLDNQVQSFSQLAALPAAPTYRFERTLSQQADPTQQGLEALADPALHRAGLRRDDATPRFSVQVGARVERVLSPYASPWDTPWGWGGWGLGYGGRHFGVGLGGPWPAMQSTWIQREVSVILRDLGTNRVVYETRAVNEGPWLDNRTVLAAMFEAALQGFPASPAGPRRVDIQVGGQR